jgi:Mce-associated membrane protein
MARVADVNVPVPQGGKAEEAEQPGQAGLHRSRRTLSRLSRRFTIAGLAGLLVALCIAATLLALHNRTDSDRSAQREQAVAVARQVATDLTSINANNAQAKIASLTQSSTGSFHSQISSYAALVQTLLQGNRAGSTGTVSAAGIERMDSSTASALLAVTATTSNQPLSYRLAIQLQRENGRWLVSDVRFVS